MDPQTDGAGQGLLRELGELTVSTYRVSQGFAPLLRLLASEADVTREELGTAVDRAFDALYRHPLLRQTERLTAYLRSRRLIPNEQSTEELIRFVVEQLVARSPVPVPDALVQEFWQFFDELFASPELKGLGELTLDMVRLVIRTYEPLLVEVINILKAGRRFNQWQINEILRRAALVRQDVLIVRRQIRALRHIKPFFQADPKDFKTQAQIVAQMVREFGPFFVKMAQVASANADFLPEEIARELAVFHEDVPPMSEEEVNQAFLECYGKLPHKMYLDFDPARPVRSGSIGSVYFAKKPFIENGREVLRPVVIKVGRQNIDREFAIGKLVLGLAIMSSQYWAPHSKLTPFLRAMQEQVDEFVAGFVEELDFDQEAESHLRFYQRSLHSRMWRVPELYGHTRRIIEMEYLVDAASLTRALRRLPASERRRFQRQVSERLLYTLLYHVFVYREMHGDLHPGNVMIGSDGTLHLIDWGNVVPLDGKWRVVWDYLVAAVIADTDMLTDALIRVSTQPQANAARRAEIKSALDETLRKKGVQPLTRRNFMHELRHGGLAGLHRRGQTVLHLMSNTQQAGVVLKRDYLHLSRALFAAAGSFGSLYENDSKRRLALDLARGLARLPLTFTQDRLYEHIDRLRKEFVELLPLPRALRARMVDREQALHRS
ncbi:Predicted unusual protein kinase regulating ubiquinone biosynthesis, AarF/ABC1/UbiB family [Fontimonas thermophila]|uniref:Predicted unusual protein kinase regulating ubiquinone biosynthesis, AarF/ABC1/UbiB family n=1 Tax=Fontimonas thermophila TaxID=1076937 RepID=A0A1I2HVS6_9GAMM|nr:AarF/ABC1/UbiB kinase family protein [Fontimonas thermophila]SFF32837.1 Predicted unusual protein kinase regulating ubiquinone biosynthesis, AarF/ABC1/UbiB family [Fontimonas thermophila]